MQGMRPGKVGRGNAPALAGRWLAAMVLAAAAVAGGCGTTIQTPLPEAKPMASTAMTSEERKKAVEELDRKRATHEHDAEQQIEQSR
jgi:hypothetical protein